ncbi:hypothetical protein [Microbacterium sp.]|uniref:hypothetical protein n=1 Tax=Microbacterium sp. TaxID=51671 RepID=UPI0039E3027C
MSITITTFHPVPVAEGWRVGTHLLSKSGKRLSAIYPVVGWSVEDGEPRPVYARSSGLEVMDEHFDFDPERGTGFVYALLAPGEHPDDEEAKAYVEAYMDALIEKTRKARTGKAAS